ncbi:MAG: hypothetical protein JSS35_14150, partial [Proteobacteria bacterium]|nr:hypothetical protein [Pseudomonadota bacterium]
DIEKVTRQSIPSWDRRNDRQLGAATAALPDPGGKPERPDTRGQGRGGQGRGGQAQPHRGAHKPKRNRNHGGGGQGGQRHEGAPARPGGEGQRPAAQQPASKPGGGFKGPRRGRGGGGGSSSGRTGVWSNR